MKEIRWVCVLLSIVLSSLFFDCARVPHKNYYTLNYMPQPIINRHMDEPYPYIIRLKEFSIEEAYNRSQIVYRLSPFELRYYIYRVWAVRPTRMITDLVYKHLTSINLVSGVVRRFDEARRPDYELTGMIEALEEYDSEDITFAHLAMRIDLTRIEDGRNVYNRRFDLRKKVYRQEPEFVIRELSAIMEYIMTQALMDIDTKLAKEYGLMKKSDDGISEQDAYSSEISDSSGF